MDIKNTAITAKVVIESLICLLENENIDVSSIKFKVAEEAQGIESPQMEFQKLIDLALTGLDEVKNSNAVPEGFVLVPKECSDDMAEIIAITARVCGGIAGDVYDAVVKQAMVEVRGMK